LAFFRLGAAFFLATAFLLGAAFFFATFLFTAFLRGAAFFFAGFRLAVVLRLVVFLALRIEHPPCESFVQNKRSLANHVKKKNVQCMHLISVIMMIIINDK
jgi:hypothetical protein